jgi:hypothetical protein
MPRTKKSASTEAKPAASEAVQARKGKIEEEVYLQIGGQEWNISDCRERAAAAYIAEGHKEAGIKKLVVYLKPDEGKAYYVVNDSDNGSIAL